MQILSALKSDFLYLAYLCDLQCKHSTIYFPEKEMQNQRHEVCLKYKGSDSGALSLWPSYVRVSGQLSGLWNDGMMEYWSTGVLEHP
jgi:hypothetical protein